MEKQSCPAPLEGLSPQEIYTLCGAIDIESLFGLGDKKTLLRQSEDHAEALKESLKKKEILDSEGKLTKRAVLLIKALETYSQSKEYARINNLWIALSGTRKEDHVVILFEDEKDASYRLELWPRKRIISLLMATYDFFRKPADAKDFEYLRRDLEESDLERAKKTELTDRPVLNVEWFRRPAAKDTQIGYEHKLFFSDNGEIVQLDIVEQTYAHASLFYLYKQVFDWLHIPCGKEALMNHGPKH